NVTFISLKVDQTTNVSVISIGSAIIRPSPFLVPIGSKTLPAIVSPTVKSFRRIIDQKVARGYSTGKKILHLWPTRAAATQRATFIPAHIVSGSGQRQFFPLGYHKGKAIMVHMAIIVERLCLKDGKRGIRIVPVASDRHPTDASLFP